MLVVQHAVSVIANSPRTMVACIYATIAGIIGLISLTFRHWHPKKET